MHFDHLMANSTDLHWMEFLKCEVDLALSSIVYRSVKKMDVVKCGEEEPSKNKVPREKPVLCCSASRVYLLYLIADMIDTQVPWIPEFWEGVLKERLGPIIQYIDDPAHLRHISTFVMKWEMRSVYSIAQTGDWKLLLHQQLFRTPGALEACTRVQQTHYDQYFCAGEHDDIMSCVAPSVYSSYAAVHEVIVCDTQIAWCHRNTCTLSALYCKLKECLPPVEWRIADVHCVFYPLDIQYLNINGLCNKIKVVYERMGLLKQDLHKLQGWFHRQWALDEVEHRDQEQQLHIAIKQVELEIFMLQMGDYYYFHPNEKHKAALMKQNDNYLEKDDVGTRSVLLFDYLPEQLSCLEQLPYFQQALAVAWELRDLLYYDCYHAPPPPLGPPPDDV